MIINFNSTTLTVQPDDQSNRYRQLMGSDSVTLIFSMLSYTEIPVGAYIDYQGQRYTMLTPQNFTKISSRNYEYTLVFEAAKGTITKYKLKDIASKRLKFPLTAKPAEFLQMIVANLNLRETGWIAGDCIAAAEKTVSFSYNNCAEALQMVAEAFETEWHIDDKTIHLKKIEYNKTTPLALSYGKGNGFKSGIKRENNNEKDRAIERLYPQGGERNIDASKYGSKQLLLPKSQLFTYEGKQYISDENGYSIIRNDKPLATNNEGSIDCTEIYPQREGTISAVATVEIAKNFYDIVDSGIPESLNYLDNIIKGETMTVIFQSGMLAGREFEVKYYHNAIGAKAARRFEIVPQEIDGQTMPNETFKPAVNDKYKVFNVEMPDAWVCDNTTQTGAEWDMYKKSVKYMAENENPNFTFTGQLDSIWAETNWLNIGGRIKIGGYVSFSDAAIVADGVLIRIIGIKDYLNKPYQPEIEISNAPVSTSISSVIAKVETAEVVVEKAKAEGIQFTKRNFRNAKETMDMLNASLLNYTGSINPITVQTMQLIAGDESLQFRFVTSKTAPSEVDPTINWTQDTKVFNIGQTILQHMTIGIQTIGNTHAPSEYLFWDMASFQSPPLTDASKKYYIYAKTSKTNQTGAFILSETAIAIESVPGYYHFLIGVLNSEFNEMREIATLYGFTEILPSRIVTNKIVSNDGNTFFDLLNGIISGKITFKSGSSGLTNLSEWASAAQDIQDAQETANQAIIDAANAQQEAQDNVADYNAKFATIQAQVDGEVNNWFYAYAPTLANYPANAWTENTERDRHVGDTFTNTQPYVDASSTPDAGKSWRYVKNSGVYSWTTIADSDAVKALQKAATAQSTADGKSSTYLIQPTKYGLGDSWVLATDMTVNGTPYKAGETLTSTQASQTYNAAHWTKKVRYTDDTAVNNLQIGGRNLVLNSDTRLETNGYILGYITLAADLQDGEVITITAWGNLADGQMLYVALFPSTAAISFIQKNSGGTYSATVTFNKSITYPNDLRNKLALYNYTTPGNLTGYISKIKIERGNKATDWSPAPEDVQAGIDNAQNTANSANQSVTTLNDYVDGAFKDGVIDSAEAKAIEKYINTVNTEYDNAISSYDVVVNNSYLEGAPKTTLINAKETLAGAKDSLMSAISTAIADGKASTSEKADVDAKYTLYKSAFSSYSTAIENANKAIQQKLDALSTEKSNAALAKAAEADYLKAALTGSTDIAGGLVGTNVILLKTLAGLITGGMSGLADDNIGFWTGGTYADAIANLANIILRKNGSGQLAGGKINWDAGGGMNIGLFSIFSNLLSSGNIALSNEALENLTSIAGSTSSVAGIANITANSTNGFTNSTQSGYVSVSKNSLIKFRVTRVINVATNEYATLKIYLKDSNGATIYTSDRSQTASANLNTYYDYAYNVPAGSYRVMIELEMYGSNSANYQTVGITGYGGVGTAITGVPLASLTKIANNGIYSYWGASAYMYLRTDYGFEVRFGNYGIQVSTAGLKKMTDGTNWVTL